MSGIDGIGIAGLITGNALGLDPNPATGSLSWPAQDRVGHSAQGRNGELAFVNLATGNLVLQDRDSVLVGTGPDTLVTRTYNSQGRFDDDNGDNWRIGLYQSAILIGTAHQPGSSIVRTAGDGSAATYLPDARAARYFSSAGSGAYDSFTIDATTGNLIWTNGDDGVIETYAAIHGHLLSITDRSGNRLDYRYGATGLLSQVTNQRSDGSGEATFLDYTQNQLTRIRTVVTNGGVNNAGVTTSQTRIRYEYDGSNRLSAAIIDLTPADDDISDGNTYQTFYSYDGTSKRIARITQSDGTSLSFTYIQTGSDFRIASITDGLGRITSYTYDLQNGRSSVTDPSGQTSTYTYDPAGQLTQITGPAVNGQSATQQFVYNANGDVTRVTDATGRSIDLDYDERGNQIGQADSAGNRVTRIYDAHNQLIAESIGESIAVAESADGSADGSTAGSTTGGTAVSTAGSTAGITATTGTCRMPPTAICCVS